MRSKKFEELTFIDDFMFCNVLTSNPELCKELTELIIGREISKIVTLEDQKTIRISPDNKSIRFDVYFKDAANVIYDIEMQTSDSKDLPKRTRYYQSILDSDALEKGKRYYELNDSYIIFICPFNPLDGQLHKYSFNETCQENKDLLLPTGSNKIFLCTEGQEQDISPKMIAFLRYVSDHLPTDDFTDKIDSAVRNAKKSKEWRAAYMTYIEQLDRKFEQGVEIGKIQMLNSLVNHNILSLEQAANELNISIQKLQSEFEKLDK